MRRLLIATAAALALLAGTAVAGFSITYPKGPDPAVAVWKHWPYSTTCGGPLIDPIVAFGGQTDAEKGPGGPEGALRGVLERDTEGALPKRFWRLISSSDTQAEFVEGRLETAAPFWLEVQQSGGQWSAKKIGECIPRSVRDGEVASKWDLVPRRRLGPKSTTIPIEVSERACTGGLDPNPRVEAPGIEYRPHRLIVTVWVAPSSPPAAGTCVENPENPPYRLRLPRPLGDRSVWDGGTFPPRQELPRRSRRLVQ